MNAELAKAVQDYSAAEEALRAIVENASSLQSARESVDLAFETLEAAGTRVGQSHESLQELAGRLADSADALRAAAMQATAAAQALATVDPERLVTAGEETQGAVHELGTRLQQVIEARTSAVTDAVVASVNSSRGDTSAEVRAVATDVLDVATEVTHINAAVERLVRRQRLLIWICVLTTVLAGAACVAVLVA